MSRVIETKNLYIHKVKNAEEGAFVNKLIHGDPMYKALEIKQQGGFYDLDVPFGDYIIRLKGTDDQRIGAISLSFDPKTSIVARDKYLNRSLLNKGYGGEASKSIQEEVIKPLIGKYVQYVPELHSYYYERNYEEHKGTKFHTQKSLTTFKGSFGMVENIYNTSSLLSGLKNAKLLYAVGESIVLSNDFYTKDGREVTDIVKKISRLNSITEKSLDNKIEEIWKWIELLYTAKEHYTVLSAASYLQKNVGPIENSDLISKIKKAYAEFLLTRDDDTPGNSIYKEYLDIRDLVEIIKRSSEEEAEQVDVAGGESTDSAAL